MADASTRSPLADRWVDQWHRADEICRLLEDLVPRGDDRPPLHLVPPDDDDTSAD